MCGLNITALNLHTGVSIKMGILFWSLYTGAPTVLGPYSVPLRFRNTHTDPLVLLGTLILRPASREYQIWLSHAAVAEIENYSQDGPDVDPVLSWLLKHRQRGCP